jgi:hypothetical protein
MRIGNKPLMPYKKVSKKEVEFIEKFCKTYSVDKGYGNHILLTVFLSKYKGWKK